MNTRGDRRGPAKSIYEGQSIYIHVKGDINVTSTFPLQKEKYIQIYKHICEMCI